MSRILENLYLTNGKIKMERIKMADIQGKFIKKI